MQRKRAISGRYQRLPFFVAALIAAMFVTGALTLATVRDRFIAAALVCPPLALLAWSLRRLRVDWARLLDRENHLSTTLRSISDGVITTDEEGRVLTMNRQAEQYTGWREDEAKGQRLNQILQLVHRDSGDFLTNSFGRVLKANTPVHLPANTLLQSRDGTERSIESTGTPIRDEQGVCTGAILIIRDVTERSIADLALRTSQAMFRQITDNVSDIITVHELDGRMIFRSRAGQALARSGSVLGSDGFSEVAPEDREQVHAAFAAVVTTGAPQRAEYRWLVADDQLREVESVATLIRDAENRPHRVLAVTRDVTERKQAEERLVREKEFSESVLRSLPAVFFLCDPQRKILRWNRNFELMTGRSSEEIPGLDLVEIIAPAERELFSSRVSECFVSGRMDGEVHVRQPIGRLTPCYVSGLRIDADGGPAMIGIGIDISARKAAEQTLVATSRRLEKQNAALAEQARNPALRGEDLTAAYHAITEIAARTLGVSRASLWLYSDEGQTLRCIDLYEYAANTHSHGLELKADQHPRYFAALAEGRVIPAHYARNDPRTREFTLDYLKPLGITSMLDAPIRIDGKMAGVICHEHTGSPREWTLDEQSFAGAMADLVVLSMEIAQRRQAERGLREAHDQLERKVEERTRELSEANARLTELDRLKSEFLAMMSHELRTPLNSIIGFTGILRQQLPGPLNDEQKKQLGMVHFSAKHLLSLINDLLDLSRIESGRMDIYVEDFRVADVVTEVRHSLEPLVSQKKLTLNTSLAEPDLAMECDRKKTFQILLNLANNAVKFTEKGEVLISVRSAQDDVCFEVTDTGIGITEEQMGSLFQAFRQIDGSARRVFEGTGLGLYLCKQLVSMLGGTIGVRSKFGSGSCFHFTLPRHPRHTAP